MLNYVCFIDYFHWFMVLVDKGKLSEDDSTAEVIISAPIHLTNRNHTLSTAITLYPQPSPTTSSPIN